MVKEACNEVRMLRFSLWLLLIVLSTSLFAKDEASPTAVQVVEAFQEELLSTMRDGKNLGFDGRYKKLEPVVRDTHDLERVARIVLGKHWGELSEEQRRRFQEVFGRLSVATYAYNFKDYSGERFEFDSEEDRGKGNKIVHTTFVDSEGEEVRFDYMMKQSGGRWLIINIIANGVSDLALKRSEYASIMEREGFDGLLAKIEGKIEEYSTKDT